MSQNNYEHQEVITKYLDSIGKITPLTHAQTVAIAKRVREGDKRAYNDLLVHNLKYVVSVAKNFRGMGVDFEDLISEGNFGLMKAIEKYEPDTNYRFTTYAVWWIRNALHKCIERKKNNGIVTEDDCLGQYVEEYRERSVIRDSFENREDEDHFNLVVGNMLSHLDERENAIIRLSFGFDGEECMTMEEISAEMGMTVERVRQIKEGAITKLRTVTMQMNPEDVCMTCLNAD